MNAHTYSIEYTDTRRNVSRNHSLLTLEPAK